MSWFNNFLQNLFPTACSGCKRSGDVFCANCVAALQWIQAPICQHCGDGIQAEEIACARCKRQPPNIKLIRGAVWFEGSIQNAVQQLKYSNKFGIAPTLADIMARSWPRWHMPIDLIIPIPLHPDRLKKRTYNQAALLAEPFAEAIGAKFEADGLFRRKSTRTQVGLSMNQRRKNVHDAFMAAPQKVAGKRILLVDDVCTTGSTMIASAETLVSAGAVEVSGFCLARAKRISNNS